MTSARFITFEGGEGAGKTTQVDLLAAALEKAGHKTLATREPGGSPAAEQIRDLLFSEQAKWDALTECLLLSAARRDHLVTQIWPALVTGQWVLADRFADSTLAYQGYGKGLDRAWLNLLYQKVAGDFMPDLTILLDLPAEIGLKRTDMRGKGNNRYEAMDIAFHKRLREGFLSIAKAAPERVVVIDGTATVAAIHADVQAHVAEKLGVRFS